jgi:hypothetical protein
LLNKIGLTVDLTVRNQTTTTSGSYTLQRAPRKQTVQVIERHHDYILPCHSTGTSHLTITPSFFADFVF